MALVGHWSLAEDDYSSGVFQDLTANNNDGTPANAPTFTTNQQDREDRAVVFNGVDDVIACGTNITEMAFQRTDPFSVSTWINPDDGNPIYTAFVQHKDGTNYDGWSISIYNNVGIIIILATSGFDKYSVTLNSGLTIGSWNHVLFTYDGSADGSGFKLYINNVEKSLNIVDNDCGAAINYTTATLEIGRNAYGSLEFAGDICNTRVYDHELTTAERTNIYGSELFWHTELISGSMDFSGSLSAQNPKWLLLDKSLNWLGEWVATYSYDIDDAVLYKISDGNEWHIFVSKIGHNVGNVPTTSPAAWRRYYQEQLL